MRLSFAFLILTMLCPLALLLHSQTESPAASAGVYTKEQAARGLALYRSKCSSCHNEDLSGGGTSPALAGPDFTTRWSGQRVAALFNSVHSTMPSDRPGTLTTQETADVVALLLKANGFPAGKDELPPDTDHLKSILIDDAP